MKTIYIVLLLNCVVMVAFGFAEPPMASPDLLALEQNEEIAVRAKSDPRVRQYILPKRIVWESNNEQSVVENATHLLRSTSGQVMVENPQVCTLRNKGKSPGILLDFGRELHGGVQITCGGCSENKPVRLRVRFGESASEAMSDVGGTQNATNDHAIRDQAVLVPWLGTTEIGNTGFRFVRVDMVDPGKYVSLTSVRAVFIYRDIPYMGSFRCSDERLNRIWMTGAYTVHLNMQDYLWDGIKRDRLVWIGDMHPETMTICSVFGERPVVSDSLDFVRDATPLPKWMNSLNSYSMWWVLIHHSWYRHHGNLEYLRKQEAYLAGLLCQLAEQIGPDGQEQLSGGRFLDWPSKGNDLAVHAGLQSLLIMTFDAGAEMCEVLGDEKTRDKCREAVTRLRKHVPDCGNSKQAAALMALAGLGDAVALNRNVMAVDGAKRMSTFYGYYVLQARAKAGDYQGCLDCIRDYWGAMLDLGATTFWEDFDLDWTKDASRIDGLVPAGKKDIHGDFGNHCYKGLRHSLCHGWASGPTAWLSEHVLGVKIVEPGCKAVRIEPHLGDLEWAEGTFPTPMGVIKLRHDKNPDGSVRTKVQSPPGVRVIKVQ